VTRRTRISIATAAAFGAVAVALVPAPADATTEPEVITPIGVRITDRGVALSQANVDRGAIVKFTVLNASKAQRSFTIAGRRTHVLPAQRGKQIFFMTFDIRGDYPYRSWGATKKIKVLTGVFHVV